MCTMYARVRTPEADLFLIRIRLNCSTRVSETKASKSIKMGNVKQNQHHTLAVVVCPILLNKARAPCTLVKPLFGRLEVKKTVRLSDFCTQL